jgi:hypothetical protein
MHLKKMGKVEITKHIAETCKLKKKQNKTTTTTTKQLDQKENENHTIKLQTDNCQARNNFIRVAMEQKNVTVRNSNRPKNL